MDQGVIYTFKVYFMELYYNKMVSYVLARPDEDDPMSDFSRMYNIKDNIMDIGEVWDII